MGATSDNGTMPAEMPGRRRIQLADPTRMGFFGLSAFFFVYCARPEDWFPGLKYIPCAKVTAILAMWGLFTALGKTKRTFKDVPKEGRLLLLLIGLLFGGAFFSPIWRGGAIVRSMDFAKVFVVYMLVFLLVTNFDRLRKIIRVQAA